MDDSIRRARIIYLKKRARAAVRAIHQIGWPKGNADQEAAFQEGSPFYQHLLTYQSCCMEIRAIYDEISLGIHLKEDADEGIIENILPDTEEEIDWPIVVVPIPAFAG